MKTLKTVITSALFVSVAMAGMVYAAPMSENELYDTIHPESADIFNSGDYRSSGTPGIVSAGDNHNKSSVWSVEFEEYVNPADFKQAKTADSRDINELVRNNPTAAGKNSRNVFVYNEVAGEYHLQ